MKMIKDGIAKTIPADRVEDYKAKGWAELMPAQAEKKPAKKASGKKEA